jgi:hypothetical protein
MFGWNNRPTKASVKHLIGGDNPATVYSVGKYEVTVPGAEAEVTYCAPSDSRFGDPRDAFPNMRVEDGEVRLPVSDLVDTVLSRVEPVELAQALWTNKDVREEFIGCMTHTYWSDDFGDEERRKFLSAVKEQVHLKAVSDLASTMGKLEWELTRYTHFYNEIRRINDVLRQRDVKVRRSKYAEDGSVTYVEEVLQFNEDDRQRGPDDRFQRGALDVGGKSWEEARNWWREKVTSQFPFKEETEA